MKIIIDTREQRPFDFSQFEGCEIVSGTLETGDYSVLGFASEIAVERKSIDDLIGCLTHDRDRFRRELERLRGYNSALLVIETPFNAIRGGFYRGRMNPEAAAQSVISMSQKYRLPVFFASSKTEGAYFTFHFLRHFLRHEAEKVKRLQFAEGMT